MECKHQKDGSWLVSCFVSKCTLKLCSVSVLHCFRRRNIPRFEGIAFTNAWQKSCKLFIM
jgi:hypothetical protein